MGYKFAYLIANFFFLVVWLLIFWKAKNLRRPMLGCFGYGSYLILRKG